MSAQPLWKRKQLLVVAIGLFAIAGFVVLFQQLRRTEDIDPGRFDSAGFVAALQFTETGARAVLISPRGEVLPSPDATETTEDRAIAWQPDGQRLYILGLRGENEPQIYRWNPARGVVERRTIDRGGSQAPAFPLPGEEGPALIIVGGFVREFFPATGTTRQILPPVGRELARGEEGLADQFDILYGSLGESFREARWARGRNAVVAVMRAPDREVLIVQDLTEVQGPEGPRLPPPVPLFAGERIEFDVAANGTVAVAVQDFQFVDPRNVPAEFVDQAGRVRRPFAHALFLFDPAKVGETAPPQLVTASTDDQNAFASPRLSPDGSQIAILVGPYDGFNVEVKALVRMPARANGGAEARAVLSGKVSDPSWHPNGRRMVYVKSDTEGGGVFSIDLETGTEVRLTREPGDFASPLYSPASR